MVYESPTTPTSATQPTNPAVAQQPNAAQPGVIPQPAMAQPTYPRPVYRPYYNASQGQPLQYNQYSSGYVPPGYSGQPGFSGQVAPPTTLRQMGQQLPGVLINEATRGLGQPR
jgi:hypothetical protein